MRTSVLKFLAVLASLVAFAPLPQINAQSVLPLVEKDGLFFVNVQVNERPALLLFDGGHLKHIAWPDTGGVA